MACHLESLVEDFVAGAPHEVGVHELGDDAAAFESVADGSADDGGLGDGRVEEAVIGERLGEAAVNGEGSAPIAVLLAESDHGGIGGEAVQEGFEERVAHVEGLHAGDGLAGVERRAEFGFDLPDARVPGEVLSESRCGA